MEGAGSGKRRLQPLGEGICITRQCVTSLQYERGPVAVEELRRPQRRDANVSSPNIVGTSFTREALPTSLLKLVLYFFPFSFLLLRWCVVRLMKISLCRWLLREGGRCMSCTFWIPSVFLNNSLMVCQGKTWITASDLSANSSLSRRCLLVKSVRWE